MQGSQIDDDIVLGVQFVVSIPNIPFDLGFVKVSGLNATIEPYEHVEVSDNVKSWSLPGRVTPGTVVLERGISTGTGISDWFHRNLYYLRQDSQEFDRRTVTIRLVNRGSARPTGFGLGRTGLYATGLGSAVSTVVRTWRVYSAWPIRLEMGQNLDASSGAVAVEALELANEGISLIQ